MKKIVEIKNLNVKYNEHSAIKNITLTVNENEYICLVGKNGSGKSTLLKAITGLIKKESGDIKFSIPSAEVSYLAQNNMTDSDFPATAKEIIMTGVQKKALHPFYSKQDESEYKSIIKELKIEDIENKKIGDLSGGQRQRVLLARTLISKPKLLLLDEPCSGLDTQTIKIFYTLLDKLHQEKQTTIIMATHDLDHINNENIRVISLEQEIIFDDNIKEYQNQSKE